VEAFETVLDGMTVYLINGDPIRANGSVYSLDSKLDAEKYTFFSLAALELPNQSTGRRMSSMPMTGTRRRAYMAT
jgi:hypothetical protein